MQMEDSVMRPVSWYDDDPQTSKSKKICLKNLNPIPHWGGGGGADSTRPQIAFFVTSIRDAVGPQNLATFPKI